MKRILSTLLALFLSSAFAAPPAGYPTTACAVENATCKIAAPGNLVFGDAASGKFDAPLHVTADTPCTLATFAKVDPIYGTVKACFFLPDPVAPPPICTPAPTPVCPAPPPPAYPTDIGWYPAALLPIAVPDGAAQLTYTIAQAPGCTSTPIARQWNDAPTQSQIWVGWCQKKGKYDVGYLFVWLRSSPANPPAGVNAATVPVTWPTE